MMLAATSQKPTRPVLRYHGGKWRLAPWIISHFPDHRVYVEPYGGAASVLLRKDAAITEIWNDLESEAFNLFSVLRDDPVSLAALLELTPYSRSEYPTLYELSSNPLERARRFVARSFMGQSSKGALKKSGFDTRINPDGYAGRIGCLRALPSQFGVMAERLSGVILENRPALDVLQIYDRSDTLFYVDPPYFGAHAPHYNHEMTEDDHRALAECLHGLKGMVILSGYPSDLYDKVLFPDWHRVERKALTDGARERTEVLWLNPACHEALERVRSGGALFEAAGQGR